jgi:hypothetical protein
LHSGAGLRRGAGTDGECTVDGGGGHAVLCENRGGQERNLARVGMVEYPAGTNGQRILQA